MTPRNGEWTLRRRLVLTFIVVGVLTALIAGLTATALGRVINRNNDLLDRVGPARLSGYQLESALLDQETGVRGYVLTKQDTFLEPYASGLQNQQQHLRTIRDSIPQDDGLQDDLDRVDSAINAWRSQYADPAIAAARAGRTTATTVDDEGKALFDAVRKAIAAFQNDLTDIRNGIYDDLQSAIRTLIAVAVIALVGVLIAGLILWRALGRWVLKPLERIGAETQQVVSGSLTHKVTVDGPKEITAVAADVDAMRHSLVAALSTAVAAQDRLKEQTDQLAAQTADLQRSNTELEQFAYVASHDLQEPLRKVASFCQMLSRRYSGELDERGQQYIDFAVDGAKRMQRLINDLLAFSRVGRTTGEFEDVALDNVLDRALTSLGSTIEESDADVQTDVLPHVNGNAILLTQVFQNLIGNAIKFHGMASPRVRITVEQKDDTFEFACSDNGIGIEPQYAERVFVIFQRLHGKEQYDGTGIGLAMVRKIIEHHGGRIWLDTDAASGGGTTFRWTLPVPSELEAATSGVGAARMESNA
ncbi:CHASE3 domain-containing protein [Cryptosporangium sp. NPDC048952]|uniref:sensor histidine kinase n=1 Tax=Cryptosporangium sp. NPDC048952 TaxID=3363961 RepID=UPI00370FC539